MIILRDLYVLPFLFSDKVASARSRKDVCCLLLGCRYTPPFDSYNVEALPPQDVLDRLFEIAPLLPGLTQFVTSGWCQRCQMKYVFPDLYGTTQALAKYLVVAYIALG